MAHDLTQQARTRRRRWLWPIVSVLVSAVVAAAVAVVMLRNDGSVSTRITFEVFGSAVTPPSVIWRWKAPSGGLEDSPTLSRLPWSKTVDVNAREGELFVHATVPFSSYPSAAATHLGCRITVNGLVVVAAAAQAPLWDANCWTTLQRAFKAAPTDR